MRRLLLPLLVIMFGCGGSQVADRPQDMSIAADEKPLTKAQCDQVCRKTFLCLGETDPKATAVAGCSTSCVRSTSKNTGVGLRMRAIHRCVNAPCGQPYRDCMEGKGR